MMRSSILRVGFALLLGGTLLSACDALDIAPKGDKKDCKAKTPSDSTSTSGTGNS